MFAGKHILGVQEIKVFFLPKVIQNESILPNITPATTIDHKVINYSSRVTVLLILAVKLPEN